MATWPSYARVMFDGYGEEFDPGILRTEMERGVPIERVVNTDVIEEVGVSLYFSTKEDHAAFESWYFTTINRIGWFEWRHPRLGVVVSARFKGASIGRLQPVSGAFRGIVRDGVTLEYVR